MAEDLETRVKNRKKKRKYNYMRITLTVIIIAILAFLAFWGGFKAYEFFHPESVKVIVPDNKKINEEVLNKRINILILGIDNGEASVAGKYDDGPKRSDVIVIASIDPKKNQICLLSIPRDTLVDIPGRGKGKAAHANFYGGSLLAKQTVSNLLQIPIHYYLKMDWRGFIETVDLIGGVDLNVAKNMNYEDPYANLKIHINKGFQHMDGQTAGEYIRFRHDELGDIGRVQRQEKFFRAITSQFFTIKNILKLPTIIDTIKARIDTDMSTLVMFKVANSLKLFGKQDLKTEMLYGDFGTINGLSYWVTNKKSITKTLDDLDISHGEIQD